MLDTVPNRLLVEAHFPNLKNTNYKVTSPNTPIYNCIAWAAGESHRWWWPLLGYWPKKVPRQLTLEAFVEAYSTLGYIPCDNENLEQGFEKVAIYLNDNGEPTHAARQLSDGNWSSKLGRSHDISHPLHAIEGEAYGKVATILKRHK